MAVMRSIGYKGDRLFMERGFSSEYIYANLYGISSHSPRFISKELINSLKRKRWQHLKARSLYRTCPHTHINTEVFGTSIIDPSPPWEDQCEWHRMTRMTGPDCAVMRNLINIHRYMLYYSILVGGAGKREGFTKIGPWWCLNGHSIRYSSYLEDSSASLRRRNLGGERHRFAVACVTQ